MWHVAKLINSGKTVWKSGEVWLILGIDNPNTLKNILQRLAKEDILFYHTGGLWTFKVYDPLEFASKIMKKSYISLETVLQRSGIVFQDYSNSVLLVSDRSLSKKIHGISYEFSKIKDSILTNTIGIINTGRYMIASPERALCDRIYLTPHYYFDHISNLNVELLEKLSTIYNKRTFLEITQIVHDLKQHTSRKA